MTIRNKSSTLATINLPGICEVVGSRAKLLFNANLAPNQTVWNIGRSWFGYVPGSLLEIVSLFWCSSFGTRLPRTYPDLTNSNWIYRRGGEQGCRARWQEDWRMLAWYLFSEIPPSVQAPLWYCPGCCYICSIDSEKDVEILEKPTRDLLAEGDGLP